MRGVVTAEVIRDDGTKETVELGSVQRGQSTTASDDVKDDWPSTILSFKYQMTLSPVELLRHTISACWSLLKSPPPQSSTRDRRRLANWSERASPYRSITRSRSRPSHCSARSRSGCPSRFKSALPPICQFDRPPSAAMLVRRGSCRSGTRPCLRLT